MIDGDLLQVSFTADGIMMAAAFADGTFVFWTVETLSMVWKITLADMAAGPELPPNGMCLLINTTALQLYCKY